jgi:uroporphyrinogen-III synthase
MFGSTACAVKICGPLQDSQRQEDNVRRAAVGKATALALLRYAREACPHKDAFERIKERFVVWQDFEEALFEFGDEIREVFRREA